MSQSSRLSHPLWSLWWRPSFLFLGRRPGSAVAFVLKPRAWSTVPMPQVPTDLPPTSRLQATFADEDPGTLGEVAWVKRFVERWLADDRLRAAYLAHPDEIAGEHRVPRELAGCLHANIPLSASGNAVLRAYGRYLERRMDHRAGMRRECAPVLAPFRAWRERQMSRCQDQLPDQYNEAILHLPVAFELSKGCSVGCWFCGLSAARLESVFSASPSNRKLWRETLEVVREVAGPAAGQGIAFWATDPLDNPDYEIFCQDFHQILGRFPATTTALGPKDLDRAERLLRLSWANGCDFNRFSVLSLAQMDALTAHFSPESLLYVDLIAQTRSSLTPKAQAGKAMEKGRNAPALVSSEPSTIACVSGFLINMPNRSVRLVSPCAAGPRWPMGYRVHASSSFTNAKELRDEIARMMADVMKTAPPRDRPVRLRPDLTDTDRLADFSLSELAVSRLNQGCVTGAELALELESEGVPMAQTFHALNGLFDQGFLDDEPEGHERHA